MKSSNFETNYVVFRIRTEKHAYGIFEIRNNVRFMNRPD
jgi:hypothetical protein